MPSIYYNDQSLKIWIITKYKNIYKHDLRNCLNDYYVWVFNMNVEDLKINNNSNKSYVNIKYIRVDHLHVNILIINENWKNVTQSINIFQWKH